MNACHRSVAVCEPSVNCDAWYAPPAKCGSYAAPVVAVRQDSVIGWVEYADGFFEAHFGCLRA